MEQMPTIAERANALAHDVAKEIRTDLAADNDYPISIQGRIEVAMMKLAVETIDATRETCAKIAEDHDHGGMIVCSNIAAAIRNRTTE